MHINAIELLALKKLAVICSALAKALPSPAAREQLALTSVLVDVCQRAEIENATAKARPSEPFNVRDDSK